MTQASHKRELRTRSAREPAAESDGRRILVDRLWPRGVSKEKLAADAWVKDIAPSEALRKWFGHDPERWDGFRERYFKELVDNPDGLEALRKEMRGAKRVTLLFGAADTEHNNAVALVEYLTS
ncbi:DUF488 domain-containing protein [Luteimonas sp. A478]